MTEILFDYKILHSCQYPVPNAAYGPEMEVDCGEPAIAIVWWFEESGDVRGCDTYVCKKHLDVMKDTEENPPGGTCEYVISGPDGPVCDAPAEAVTYYVESTEYEMRVCKEHLSYIMGPK